MGENNRLQQWFDAADAEMQTSYEENHVKARDSKRIQQTGHAAEHAWGELLGNWLPPQYEVGYRKYILPEIDAESYVPRETDIVVFRPGYPRALRRKEEVLAAGVAVAFSVKLTLNASGLKEAVEEAAAVRRHVAPRLGTARQEATPPFRYGVLGHAHAFGVEPRKNVAANYRVADEAVAKHPRESLDLICIADLGVWQKHTGTYLPVWDEGERQRGSLVVDRYAVMTTLFDAETSRSVAFPGSDGHRGFSTTASPLSVFVGELYSFLAQEDEHAEPFSRGLLGAGISASGSGTPRVWELGEVYEEGTVAQLSSRIINGRDREWGMTY